MTDLEKWTTALQAFSAQSKDGPVTISVHPSMMQSAIDRGIPLFVYTLEQARDLRQQGCRLIYFQSDEPGRPPTVSEILARSGAR